jgi:hypothetical protein
LPDLTKKKAEIAELLGLLEKMGKDKYWILEQIQKKNLRVNVTPAMNSYEILMATSRHFISSIKATLENIGNTEIKLSFSNTYHWFFTDIVAAANPDVTADNQTRKIIDLTNLIEKTPAYRDHNPKSTIKLPTGDGYAIGFRDNPEKPLLLAIQLHKAINEHNITKGQKNRIDVRIGLDTGPVYTFKDLNGKHNVFGPGIIYARRIMDLGRAKSILTSDRFAETVQRLRPEFKRIMHIMGPYSIKHGEKIQIYNIHGSIYGTEIGTKSKPAARRAQKDETEVALRENARRFYYTSIEILLRVTDVKTMMTHHTLVWHLVNQYDDPAEVYFCSIDGDVPRDFSDLNVKLTDDEGKELKIKNLNMNKPLKKQFLVQLNKPLKPNQKGRFLKLEYDWEEPDRHYLYTILSDCKKLRYLLTVAKEMSIQQKIAQVSPFGEVKYAQAPATVRYFKNRTEIEWIGQDLLAFDAYRLDW